MPTFVLPESPPPFPFTTAVQNRSWDWLFELRRRLNVDVQLVDEHGTFALPHPKGNVATMLSRFITSDASGLRRSISNTARTRAPSALTIDRLQIVCFGLAPVRGVNGVLLLARELAPGRDSVQQLQSELELIGSWLTTAIEAHLMSEPTAQREDLNQVSSLCRVLTDAARSGSNRAVVAAFVEALTVWSDLEVLGYVATASGAYALEVSMPGTDKTSVPASLDPSAVAGIAEVMYLAPGDADRLGFDRTDDVALMPIAVRQGNPQWVVALFGPLEAQNNVRLSVYAKLLDHWVGQLLAQAASRITAALALELMPLQEPTDTTVAQGLEEIRSALGADAAAVVVTLANGMEWLRVGNRQLFEAGDDHTAGRESRIVVVRRAPGICTAALVFDRSDGQPFTRAAADDAAAAADVLQAWAVGILGRRGHEYERRSARVAFADLVDGLADRAVADGTPVAVALVVAADEKFRSTAMMHRWITDLRSSVRPRDVVGIVNEGEIGVLLHDTTADTAFMVMARVRQQLADRDRGQTLALSIGIATRAARSAERGSLIAAARADTTSRTTSLAADDVAGRT